MNLSDYIKSHPPGPFRPLPFYNQTGDQLTWYWSDAPSYEEAIHHDGVWIGSILRNMHTKEVTGIRLFGVAELMEKGKGEEKA